MSGGPFTLVNAAVERLNNGSLDWDGLAHYMVLTVQALVPDVTLSTEANIDQDETADSDYAPQDMSGEIVTLSGGVSTADANDQNFGATVTITSMVAWVLEGTVAGKADADLIVGFMALNLQTGVVADASAVIDPGGGEVDIPSTAHGFSTGDNILIRGTDNYDNYYVVVAGTTTNLIRITATFVVETLAVTDTIDKLLDVTSTAGSYDINFNASGLWTLARTGNV